jgi:hypothetical protein
MQKGQGNERGARETSPGAAERDPPPLGTVARGSTSGESLAIVEDSQDADDHPPIDPKHLSVSEFLVVCQIYMGCLEHTSIGGYCTKIEKPGQWLPTSLE